MHIIAVAVWLILEFTRFKKTRWIVACVAVLLTFNSTLRHAMHAGPGAVRIRQCMHNLSSSVRVGDTNRVLSALQDVSDNILSDEHPAITFMRMDRTFYELIIDETGANKTSEHISEGRKRPSENAQR